MRRPAAPALAALALLGCRPTATVERTTPVASLEIYRTLALRVAAAGEGGEQVGSLERAIAEQVNRRCSFERVATGGGAVGADLVIDVNVQRAGRGSDGPIQNENVAFLNALVVLSDAVDGELLGSATVKGKSSAVLIQGAATPEEQAVDVVAQTIAEILVKSGCEGARAVRPGAALDAGPEVVAPPPAPSERAPGEAPDPTEPTIEPAPPPPPPIVDPAVADRAAAEEANEDGKRRFRAADVAGALAAFERAAGLVRDPRYVFNQCLAREGLEQYDRALQTCEEVRAMAPPPALARKVEQRLAIIRERLAPP